MILFKNKQKGISLPISLFVLLGVMLSASLLMRSGDASIIIAGSLGNRIQVEGSNDMAVSAAYKWLKDNSANLKNDSPEDGYFSSYSEVPVDYTKDENWANAKAMPIDDLGNVNYYQIVRLCSIPNAARNETVNNINNVCQIVENTTSTPTDTASAGYDTFSFKQESSSIGVLYRIVVKTEGPKKSKVITETVVSL